MVAKAALACSISGPAASKSLYVSVYFFVTSSLILAHLVFSASAALFSISTLALSTDTTSSILEASILVASASTYLILTSSSITATISYVSFNLTRPVSYLSLLAIIKSFFLVNIEVNNLINSKKVFGVVYTCLLSCSLN